MAVVRAGVRAPVAGGEVLAVAGGAAAPARRRRAHGAASAAGIARDARRRRAGRFERATAHPSPAWEAMLTEAAEARRRVGAASKWQVEQAALLTERWAEMEAPLGKVLEADGGLAGPPPPPGACVVM